MRSIKEDREIREIENALGITAQIHQVVLESCKAGRTEQEIYAKVMEVVLREGGQLAYSAILTVEGQTLHINTYHNKITRLNLRYFAIAEAASPLIESDRC